MTESSEPFKNWLKQTEHLTVYEIILKSDATIQIDPQFPIQSKVVDKGP